MHWRERPTNIEFWSEEIDYIIFFDENGSPDYKSIRKQIKNNVKINDSNRYFTLTGCIISRDEFPEVRKAILEIKNKYWENGMFYYEKWKEKRRVCFHSREIRHMTPPFSNDIIDYNLFMSDLTNFIKNCNMSIISSTIDKQKMIERYRNNAIHPYELSISFILERVSKYYLEKEGKNAALIFESRGKKEDKFLLQHMINMIEHGTNYVDAKHFKNIVGIYFNNKWCHKANNEKTYIGLEIADLCSYPIFRYTIDYKKSPPFKIIEDKIYGQPDYWGKGIKKFP